MTQPTTAVGADQCRQFVKGLLPKTESREIWIKSGHDSIYRAEWDEQGNLSGILTACLTKDDPLSRQPKGKPIPNLIEHLEVRAKKEAGGVFYIPTQPIGLPIAAAVVETDDIGVEMDHLSLAEQKALIAEFCEVTGLEFASVLTSGGASVHVHLKFSKHLPIEQAAYWRRLAIVAFQSDPVTERLHQPMRLPGFYRKEKESYQELLSLSDRRYTEDELLIGFDRWFDHKGWALTHTISDQWWKEAWFPLLRSENKATPHLKASQTAQFLIEGDAAYVNRRAAESAARTAERSPVANISGQQISDVVSQVCDRAQAGDFPGVDWQGSSGHYRGQCPFHQGKTGNSAWLSDKDGGLKFHCVSCTNDAPRSSFEYWVAQSGVASIESPSLKGRDYAKAAEVFLGQYGLTLPKQVKPETNGRSNLRGDNNLISPRAEVSASDDANKSKPDSKKMELDDFIALMREIEVKHGFLTSKYFWELEYLADNLKRSSKFLQSVYNRHLSESCEDASETFSDVCKRSPTEVPWLIPDMLYRGGTTLFHAAGGCGKTLLTYNLIRGLSQTGEFIGRKVKEKVRCGLIQVDEPEIPFVERIKELGLQETDNLVKLNWSFGLVSTLDKWIEDNELGVVIIDSFFAAQKYAETKENDSDHAAILMRLRDIAQRTKSAIIVVHHSNKKGESRGTGAIPGAVSEVWHLTAPNPEIHSKYKLKSDERIFECEKTRMVSPFKMAIALEGESLTWKPLGDLTRIDNGTANEPATATDRVKLFIDNRVEPFTISQLLADRTMLGLDRESVRPILVRLKKKGFVDSLSTEGKTETEWIPPRFEKNEKNRVMVVMVEGKPLVQQDFPTVTSTITTSITREDNVTVDRTITDAACNGSVMDNVTVGEPLQGNGFSPTITTITQKNEFFENDFYQRQDLQKNERSPEASRAPLASYTGPLPGDTVKFIADYVSAAERAALRKKGIEYPWGQSGTVTGHAPRGTGYAVTVVVGSQSFVVTNLLAIETTRSPKTTAPTDLHGVEGF